MSQLPKLIARRKTVRARVTSLHNRRFTFAALSNTDVISIKANIVDYKDDLKSWDDLIQNLKFGDPSNIDEDALESETDNCEEYLKKLGNV